MRLTTITRLAHNGARAEQEVAEAMVGQLAFLTREILFSILQGQQLSTEEQKRV